MTTTYCKRVAVGCMLALAAFLYCALPALAQQTLGSINGTVLDTSGASVSDATITVTDSQIDVTRTAKSGANGFFQIFNLPIGAYKVTVSRDGFETTDQSGITVQEAHTTTVNISLKVGNRAETVEVTANPLLNATDPTNGYTLDSTQIEQTPLATGSFTQLAVLSPGVNAELLSGIGTNAGLGNQPIWANGQRDTSNTFQVNGVDVTNLFNGKSSSSDTSQRYNFNIGSGATGGAGNVGGTAPTSTSVYGSNGNSLPSPPPDFLQELRVNASLYDAQQGATSGAQIDANTATGTNKFHGSAFGTRATNAFNAAPFFFNQDYLLGELPAALRNPQLHRSTIGGTAGGPLWKDKLFFFLGYQNLHDTDQTTGLSQLEVPYALTDDRSNTGLLAALNSYLTASGSATKSSVTVDPVAATILNAKLLNGQYLIPSVQNPDPSLVAANQSNVTLTDTSKFSANQATAALDYDISTTDRLSAKYYYQHDPAVSPHVVSSTGGFPGLEDNGAQVFALGNTKSIGSRINWEQRLGFVRMKSYSTFGEQLAGVTDPTLGVGFPGATEMGGLLVQHFNKSSGASLQTGPYSAFVNDGYFQNRVNPSTNLIFVLGKHTFIAGGGYSYTQLNVRNQRSGIGEARITNFSTFLAGSVNKSNDLDSIGADGHNYSDRYYRSNEVSGYLQDKFQALPNLSITAGVRYDYHGGLTEKYGNIFNFDPALYNVTGSTVTDGASADGTTNGFTVNNAGFIVASNNKYYPTKGVSDSTLTGRQWGVSPRIGFAWSPKQNQGKVVFSGGAGMYYDRGELFSYLSQPAGGTIGGPFGATEAPPLASYINGAGTKTLANPLGSATVVVPNANPAYFTSLLQSTLSEMVADCGADYNQEVGSCDAPFSFGAYARDNKLPYTYNYTLKFQWQPLNDLAITIGYSGNRGRHGVVPVPFNQPLIAAGNNVNGETTSYGWQVLNANAPLADGSFAPIPGEAWDTDDGGNVDFRAPYPGYSPNAALFKAAGTSAYDALETHLEKHMSHGVSAGVSYTWSHALDEQSDVGLFFTGNNPNNLHQSYASSDFDRTNVFSANFQAALPNFVHSHSALSYVTNGWNLTGIGILQSGEPYSLYEYYGAVGSVYYGNFPTLSNPVLPIRDAAHPKRALTGHPGSFRNGLNYIPAIDPTEIQLNYINPGEKGVPACVGSNPCDIYETDFAPTNQRNIFRQGAQKRLDMSLRKTFLLTNRFALQYEFNVFNITNTTSLDVPQNQTEIGQNEACNPSLESLCQNFYVNFGQVLTTKALAPTIRQSNNPSDNPLYLLPNTTGSGSNVEVTNNTFGSVTNTIGSARVITMGAHFTF